MDGSTVASKFTIHAYNDAYLDSNVVTCIFYTQKESSIIDGNLEYYADIKLKKGWFSGFFTKYKQLGMIDVDAGNIVLMSGTQLHVPQICSGFGKRNCIVVVHVVVE
jgi:hypothetical protein